MMTFEQFVELAIKNAISMARILIPYDTGNMRFNSFKLERIDEKTWRVYIDLDVAPYAPYVNEKLPSHHTPKQLANEGFFERVFEFIGNYLASALNGQIVPFVMDGSNKKENT